MIKQFTILLARSEIRQLIWMLFLIIGLFGLDSLRAGNEAQYTQNTPESITDNAELNSVSEFAYYESDLEITRTAPEKVDNSEKVESTKTSVTHPPVVQPKSGVSSTPSQAAEEPISKPATTTNTTASQESSSSLSFINTVRSKAGKKPLKADSTVNGWALTHAKRLAKECSLYHQNINSLLGDSFSGGSVRSIAENVAYNSSISGALSGLKNSPGHYANMIGDYTHVGIGVVKATSGSCKGYVYTAQVFVK